MRVVITGAGGFLGSHLVDHFVRQGHDVLGIDNFITGRRQNLIHLEDVPSFSIMEHDVSKYIDVQGPVDAILHFASPASPIDYAELPIQTLKVGSLGTHNALGLAKAKGAKFLLASTSEVYGDPQVHPQTEEYWGHVNPIGPRGVYDEAKRFAEAMTMAYNRVHKVQTRIVRIFNTYGPRMRLADGRALPAFCCQALRGQDITVFGDGGQTRSFQFVDDLVKGVALLLESDYCLPVNIGNPDETSILEFAHEIVELTGSKSKISFADLPADDPQIRRPDISLAEKVLGWKPQVSRHQGLKKTIPYFRDELAKALKQESAGDK
jgi:dTDP-glucose 4,6-dehydratase